MLDEHQKGSAGTIAEQRHADDHVSEVMPQRDSEQPREQDLIGEGRRGEQRDGCEYWHRYCPRVSATKATGSNASVRIVPSASFSISISCCTRNAAPTGMTMCPPGFSCSSKGGGICVAAAVTTMASNGAASGHPK